jgi:cytochrome c biogenesis protein CcmG/thiol:disulfide interchange protein DsbE
MTTNASRGQWIAVGIILTLLVGALGVGLLLTEDVAQVTTGAEAPSFSAVNLVTGDTVTLDDYRGEVVLLNLWATYCAPCRWEMPSMERLYKALGPQGLKVVAVSVDQVGSDQVLAYANELELTFDVLHDRSGQIEIDYQATGLPESVVLDRDGIIVHKAIGPVEWDDPVQQARFRRFLGVAEPTDSATDGEAATQAGASGG